MNVYAMSHGSLSAYRGHTGSVIGWLVEAATEEEAVETSRVAFERMVDDAGIYVGETEETPGIFGLFLKVDPDEITTANVDALYEKYERR
ncbi:MAG: hypothetical protein M3P49_12730 [Actinomycetota bacterium]|nr:hypothetical protein [Actinomycetota bacterium]